MGKRKKKVTFFGLDEGTAAESVPLLSAENKSKESREHAKTSSASAAIAPRRGSSSSSSTPPSGGGEGGERSGSDDVVLQHLEGLPMLLVRSCTVFTVASCCSTLIGALRSAVTRKVNILWCLLPSGLAGLWFCVELARSLARVRRVMLDEESNRILSVRRVRRRLQQRNSRVSSQQRGRQQSRRDLGDSAEANNPSSRRSWVRRPRTADSRLRQRIYRGEFPEPSPSAAAASAAHREAADGADSGSISSPSSAEDVVEDEGKEERGWARRGSDSGSASGSFDGDHEEDAPLLFPAQRTIEREPPRVKAPFAAAKSTFDSAGGYHHDRGGGGGGGEGESGLYDDDDRIEKALEASERKARLSLSSPPSMEPVPRAVRVSFLLQAWLRLWVTMVWFGATLITFLVLLALRLGGVSGSYLPARWIASPCLLGLVILASHSIMILDGTGGFGGAPVMRSGGNRLVVGLGRRPVIFLTFLFAVLLVIKIDFEAVNSSSGAGAALAYLANKTRWGYIFLPLWALVAVVDVVYLVALWENYSGKSLTCALLGGVRDCRGIGGLGYWFCCNLDGGRGWNECPSRCSGNDDGGGGGGGGGGGFVSTYGDGRKQGDEEEEWQQQQRQQQGSEAGVGSGKRGGGDSTSCLPHCPAFEGEKSAQHTHLWRNLSDSPVPGRIELSDSQRAAAASIAGGIFLLSMTIVTLIIGSQSKEAAWGVPLTMIAAAAGLALVGAGLFRLAAAHSQMMRGPLPPEAKPLPVSFSEEDGGWVVCPPEPPVVSIFLLGDVTIRRESFGWDRGAEDGAGGSLGSGGVGGGGAGDVGGQRGGGVLC